MVIIIYDIINILSPEVLRPQHDVTFDPRPNKDESNQQIEAIK